MQLKDVEPTEKVNSRGTGTSSTNPLYRSTACGGTNTVLNRGPKSHRTSL